MAEEEEEEEEEEEDTDVVGPAVLVLVLVPAVVAISPPIPPEVYAEDGAICEDGVGSSEGLSIRDAIIVLRGRDRCWRGRGGGVGWGEWAVSKWCAVLS